MKSPCVSSLLKTWIMSQEEFKAQPLPKNICAMKSGLPSHSLELHLSTLPSPGYSMWNPWKGGWTAEIPDGFHGMGDGFHGKGDGFHTFGGWIPWVFHMDSMVFSHGFHTFSTWIPSFSRWIPWTFQMDSIWNEFMES